jgi:hypothetical protein
MLVRLPTYEVNKGLGATYLNPNHVVSIDVTPAPDRCYVKLSDDRTVMVALSADDAAKELNLNEGKWLEGVVQS